MNGLLRSAVLALFAFSSIGCSYLFYQPGTTQIFDPATKGIEYHDFKIASADGRKLHAWLFPAGKGSVERGTIIQFHGNAENITSHFYSLSWVTEKGYNFIAFDYSGYWDSDGVPGQKALNEDALSALEFAYEFNQARSEDAGNKMLFVAYGQSLGGTVLLRALADYPKRNELAAVVVDSSFPSYQDIAREKLSLFWQTWLFQPFAYLLVSDEYAPERKIASLAGTPLLVIHGTDDTAVPIHHGRRIFELAGEPKAFWEVPGGRHIDSMVRHEGKYREMFMQYLDGLGK